MSEGEVSLTWWIKTKFTWKCSLRPHKQSNAHYKLFNYKHKVMLINRHYGYSLTKSVPDTPCYETLGWCLSHSLHITPQIRICLWNFIQIRIYRVDVMVKIGTCATDKPVDQSQLPISTTWSVKSQTDPPSSFASLKRTPKNSVFINGKEH